MPEAVWPSQLLAAHVTECRAAPPCSHRLPLPKWWLLMSGRGIPMAAGREDAIHQAVRKIVRFRGQPPLNEDERAFVHALVLDCLTLAPQPVTHAWVRHTLAATATYARWATSNGYPLTREYLLDERVITRWVHVGLKDFAGSTRGVYRSRLELMQAHIRGGAVTGKRLTVAKGDPAMPLQLQDEADLWLWSRGVRGAQRRAFVGAALALGLGCGLAASEVGHVFREDISRDLRGVHVRVPGLREPVERVVTCRAPWETRLAELYMATPPGHLIVSPWRSVPQTRAAYDQMMSRINRAHRPPVAWHHQGLRSTWIVRLIEAGVPLHVILRGAGLSSVQTIVRLLPLLADVEDDDVARFLRGER